MTSPNQPAMAPLLYRVQFLLPACGRKSTYVVLAEGASEAIEVAKEAVEREHGHAVFEQLLRHEPRWINTGSTTVDLLSRQAMAYYLSLAKSSTDAAGHDGQHEEPSE